VALVLVDSVVVAGYLDRDDAFHTASDQRLRSLAGRDRLIASVVTYAELLTGAGTGHHEEDLVRGFFAELVDDLLPVDRPVAERAAGLLAAKAGLRLPDAMILATAERCGADLVIGGDATWAKIPGYGCEVELLRPVRRPRAR
jgi:predicted nucleic acid-binding protein